MSIIVKVHRTYQERLDSTGLFKILEYAKAVGTSGFGTGLSVRFNFYGAVIYKEVADDGDVVYKFIWLVKSDFIKGTGELELLGERITYQISRRKVGKEELLVFSEKEWRTK